METATPIFFLRISTMFLEHREVWHVYNRKMSGRVVESTPEIVKVLWADGRTLIHAPRFIQDEPTIVEGPTADNINISK
jgi:hypothetical protein